MTRLCVLIAACSAIIFLVEAAPAPVISHAADVQRLVNYLTQYGYLEPIDPRNGRIRTPEELITATKTLQRMGGLKDTGDLNDPALISLLNTSRCGVADIGPSDVLKRRKRRYALQGTRWSKTDLTYRIENYTPDLKREEVDKTISDALGMWAVITPLKFTKVTDQRIEVDIRIKFTRSYHGDGYPFDGPGGTLAHAFYPLNNKGISGDAHFDEDELFTLRSPGRGIDLFWVAVHEFGHSLGLQHSSDPNAIMYPFYRGYVKNFKLHRDDIRGMQTIYGSRSATQPPTYEPKTVTPHVDPTVPSEFPDKCSTSFDAFAYTEEKYTYAFKGSYFWPVGDTGAWTSALKIKEFWPLLEDNIDAAFFINGYTYFIKGDKFWKFKNRTPQKPTMEKPLPITHPELNLDASVAGMDAAMQWARNGKIYFFKGDKYWRYTPHQKKLDVGYPRKIAEGWQGAVPINIDAAVQWKNRKTYFFKGTDYLSIDDSKVQIAKVDPPYPRKTAHYWMGCSPEKMKGGRISPLGNSAFGLIPNVVMLLSGFILTKLP